MGSGAAKVQSPPPVQDPSNKQPIANLQENNAKKKQQQPNTLVAKKKLPTMTPLNNNSRRQDIIVIKGSPQHASRSGYSTNVSSSIKLPLTSSTAGIKNIKIKAATTRSNKGENPETIKQELTSAGHNQRKKQTTSNDTEKKPDEVSQIIDIGGASPNKSIEKRNQRNPATDRPNASRKKFDPKLAELIKMYGFS